MLTAKTCTRLHVLYHIPFKNTFNVFAVSFRQPKTSVSCMPSGDLKRKKKKNKEANVLTAKNSKKFFSPKEILKIFLHPSKRCYVKLEETTSESRN